MPARNEICVYLDYESLSQAAAQRFAASVAHAIQQHGQFWVALSGGSTPRRMFEILACPPTLHQIPWTQVHFFWCDERCVPPEHPESNFALLQRLLLSHLETYPQHVHRMKGELPPQQAVVDYAHLLASYAGQGMGWIKFDLVLLGLGDDGHTASLFPGAIPADEMTQPVIAVRVKTQGRPAGRITLTPPVFNAAQQVLFLVNGSSKAQALAGTLAQERDPLRYPAQRIQPQPGNLTWMVDQAAASLVSASRSDSEENYHDI